MCPALLPPLFARISLKRFVPLRQTEQFTDLLDASWDRYSSFLALSLVEDQIASQSKAKITRENVERAPKNRARSQLIFGPASTVITGGFAAESVVESPHDAKHLAATAIWASVGAISMYGTRRGFQESRATNQVIKVAAADAIKQLERMGAITQRGIWRTHTDREWRQAAGQLAREESDSDTRFGHALARFKVVAAEYDRSNFLAIVESTKVSQRSRAFTLLVDAVACGVEPVSTDQSVGLEPPSI